MKLVKLKNSRKLKERLKVIRRVKKEQRKGEILSELVWEDLKFPKEATVFQMILCHIFVF